MRRLSTLIVLIAATAALPALRPLTPPAMAATTSQLLVSSSPNRSNPVPLTGSSLSGTVYVFVGPSTGIARVKFYLDDPTMSAAPRQVEYNAPFDFAGTASNGSAQPFDTGKLSAGTHRVTAAVILSVGGTVILDATLSTGAASSPSPTPTPTPGPKLTFGMGSEASGALTTRLVAEAPVRMLSSWYNGPNDLSWMTGWRTTLVPQSYAKGYALHLIVWTGDNEAPISTPYGAACGRAYPLSARFLGDMAQLAQTFSGSASGPPLYVTLFTEFQTYPCTDNAWNVTPEANHYLRALKDQYRAALSVFHQYAPNARVSLGWGGWQARWDDPATGGGRSLFQYFADVMQASDFQSFQAMASDSNVSDIRAMTQILGAYGRVMLAHYKPDNGSQTTFEADLHTILTDTYLAEVTRNGLFAMSFMDNANLAASPDIYQFAKTAVQQYAS
jgi:hypothetical protein